MADINAHINALEIKTAEFVFPFMQLGQPEMT